MDRTKQNRWAWVASAMPGVAKLIAERKARHGDAWVNECWRKSMVEREPGWLFAREGAVAIGTPWDDPAIANFAAVQVTSTQALLVTRTPEATHGANP